MAANLPEAPGELTYENILVLLGNSDWPLATTQVAEVFDITQQSAHYRLTELHKRGDVERTLAGGTILWRLPEDQS